MLVMLDASVLIRGKLGGHQSALILATIQLGGLSGCAVENAFEEARRKLIAIESEGRLRITWRQTDDFLAWVRSAATFDVHPWVNSDPQLLPENRKDAYLFEAMKMYEPDCLLTTDKGILVHGTYRGVSILTPSLLVQQLDL